MLLCLGSPNLPFKSRNSAANKGIPSQLILHCKLTSKYTGTAGSRTSWQRTSTTQNLCQRATSFLSALQEMQRVSVHPQTKPMKCNSLLLEQKWSSHLSQTGQPSCAPANSPGAGTKSQSSRDTENRKEPGKPHSPAQNSRHHPGLAPSPGTTAVPHRARRQPQCTPLCPPPSLPPHIQGGKLETSGLR